jgi:hypothetical protein
VLAGSLCSIASALVLYAKRPFGGPQQVLSYLANYTHRVALSNRRIVALDAQHQTVTFTYRDYRHGSQRKELTLSALEFMSDSKLNATESPKLFATEKKSRDIIVLLLE